MALEAILASALVPAAVDIIKGIGKGTSNGLARFFGGLSVDDQIKLEDAGIRRLDALAKLDNPYGTPSQWVVDLRAAFRYVAAGVLIVIGASIAVVSVIQKDAATMAAGLEIAGMPFGFIFGERMNLSFKGAKAK